MSALTVKHSRTWDGKPFATLLNPPAPGTSLSPSQMHALAQALIAAALDCTKQDPQGKHFFAHELSYPTEIARQGASA